MDDEAALQQRKERFRLAQSRSVEGGIESSFESRFQALEKTFWRAFHDACAAGPQWVNHRALLISHSLPQTVNSKDAYGETMMTLAAQHGREHVVTVLLGIKGDPHCTNQKGWSAVTIAAVQNHTHLIQLFAGNRIRYLIPSYGYTPAHFVVQVHNATMLRLLHDLHANLRIAAKNGYTLLHTAAEAAADDCLTYLVKMKLIPIDARDTNNETAAHKAARRNHNHTLEILLAHGASFATENREKDCIADVLLDDLHINRTFF
ncbi:hypothetical protein ACHHYP_16590 [Achlya hypogyna]|uniref:Uncharacterized protein n=1 Tax=Achlya hypogyna TaxID=1202772 RepID=A0A1V9ZE35_ACHHY|nr:hypothetical protein ACHHYP_16590 [Achlya hypogyna]